MRHALRQIFILILFFFGSTACFQSEVTFNLSEVPDGNPAPVAPAPILRGSPESQLRMMNRGFLKSVVIDTFGTSAQTVVDELITPNLEQLGGPCSPYLGDCERSSQSQLAIVPTGLTARYALMNRVCDRVLSNDTSTLYAVRKATENPALTVAGAPPVDARYVQAAFDLFFQDQQASEDLVSGLLGVAVSVQEQGLGPFEEWRYVILTLCISPEWHLM